MDKQKERRGRPNHTGCSSETLSVSPRQSICRVELLKKQKIMEIPIKLKVKSLSIETKFVPESTMKISFTITNKTPVHISFSIHVNGGYAGSMTLRNEEWVQWCEITQPDKIYDNVEPEKAIADL